MRITPARRGTPESFHWLLTAALSAAAGLSGCASSSSTPPTTPDTALPSGHSGPGPRVAPPGTPTPAPAASNAPVAPADAKYTIVCMGFTGPNHVQQARVSKDNLVRGTGRRDFYVVHDDAQSTIYYGYYRERERERDPAEAARCTKDLEYVRGLADGEQHRLFGTALVVPLPTPDPVAPPEYDLTKVDADKSPDDPARRYWSIAIADYSNDVTIDGKGRKQLVVEAVQEARRMGVEAYYFNGPNTSTVCVGAWPRSAIREQETDHAESPADDGQELVVASSPLSKQMMDDIHKSGRDMKVVQPRVVVDDPTLLAVWGRYKEYSLNGNIEMVRATDPATGQTGKKPKDTFLVVIPRPKPGDSLLTAEPAAPQQPTASAVDPLDPLAGRSGGVGALRPQSR